MWTLVLASACGEMPAAMSDGPETRLLISPALATCDPSAPWPSRLRVATWNIEGARGSSLGEIASVLASIDAEVVLLQEVDVGVDRSGGVNQPEVLSSQLHEAYAFGEAIPWGGGHYGLAMLSRLPFQAVNRISLDTPSASERRIGLDVMLCFGPAAIEVVNTHADVVAGAGAQNVIDLVNALQPSIGKGLLLAGDFNGQPTDRGPQAAVAAGLQDVVATHDASATLGAERIDFIFADARVAPHVTSGQVVATDKSDHRPVFADLAGSF
jgi:endonuclease/exonuclease/phosphatase family metal-dependent hydrolase